MHPVTCSLLWVRCLFDRFSISDFVKVKSFENVFMDFATGHRTTFRDQFGENRPLRSCRKVIWITTEKTRAPRDSSRPPFCDRAQNSLNVVTPWPVHVYRIWSGSAAICRTYSGKIDVSAPKVITMLSAYNNNGRNYRPTVSLLRCLVLLRY